VFELVRCEHCNHIFTSNTSNSIELYETGNYDIKEKAWHQLLRPLLNLLERNKLRYLSSNLEKGASIFEIGTGKGYFLRIAKKNGFRIGGIEPSKRSFEIARRSLGDDVANCLIDEIKISAKAKDSHDSIVLWHVLEHLPEPVKSILEIKSLLSPKGILMIAVPNFDSYQSTFGKDKWYHLDPSRHISHFTPTRLSGLLTSCGFKIKEIYYDSFYQNFIGDIITLTNLLSLSTNTLLNLMRLNRGFIKRHGAILITLMSAYSTLVTLFLFFPALALTFFSQKKKKAGTMVFLAVKS
jgi:2-polyprenyl-3-methyl-5-hydroxy-6-metoxy-1,4-benzoquinol methylase